MANLRLDNNWSDGVYQLELTDPVIGGEDGIDNRQAKQLGGNLWYLRKYGISPWTEKLSYPKDALVLFKGALYRSKVDDNINSAPGKLEPDWELFIKEASEDDAGIVIVTSDLSDTSESKAATIKVVKEVSDKAVNAKNAADTAQETANSAQSAANSANTAATKAQTVASAAATLAEDAKNAASSAVETANDANSSATKALETANKCVLKTTTVCNKKLSENITLDADDTGALPAIKKESTYEVGTQTNFTVGLKSKGKTVLTEDDINKLSNKIQVIYPNGSESNPPILTCGQRVVIENPFKTSNCYAVTELYLKNEVSGEIEWFTHNSVVLDQYKGMGLLTNINDKEIIVQACGSSLVGSSFADGNAWCNNKIITSAPFRVRVIKLGD